MSGGWCASTAGLPRRACRRHDLWRTACTQQQVKARDITRCGFSTRPPPYLRRFLSNPNGNDWMKGRWDPLTGSPAMCRLDLLTTPRSRDFPWSISVTSHLKYWNVLNSVHARASISWLRLHHKLHSVPGKDSCSVYNGGDVGVNNGGKEARLVFGLYCCTGCFILLPLLMQAKPVQHYNPWAQFLWSWKYFLTWW